MKKVLVVDDEKLIVKGLKFSLEQDDMEVDTAYDGGEAIEKIKANDYDIVLLDIMIPVYTGIEVCQMVREFSNVPIIMLTAKGEDMDKIMGLEYGADDYITKPFNILEVKARIKAILRRSNRKQAPAKPSNVMEINGMKVELDIQNIRISQKLHARKYCQQQFKVFEHIKPVRFCCLNDAVYISAGFCSVRSITEQPVLSAYSKRPDRIFRCVV